MQTTVESTEKHTVKLTIEVPADQVDKDLDLTYRSIAREIKIPGFRPGKAPKPIIDAQVGRDVVLEEFVHQSVPSYFRDAVTEQDLAPIGDPEVDVEQLEPGKAFVFNRIQYCPSKCQNGMNPTDPECANCKQDGSGQFE